MSRYVEIDSEDFAQLMTLKACLRRVTDCLATFVRETEDPGAEALAALYEAQQLLLRA